VLQVDVTAQMSEAEIASALLPTGTGHQAASAINEALMTMGMATNPWAALDGSVTRVKPHKSRDPCYAALKEVVSRDGRVVRAHFRKLRQLGSGDVGTVDLVQLLGTDHQFAMKTLDKWEMQASVACAG
jgi:hypothetical protein